jgi:hypothetical protein
MEPHDGLQVRLDALHFSCSSVILRWSLPNPDEPEAQREIADELEARLPTHAQH